MAEARAEEPASMRHKIYDENDEFEIFAVELMTNLMKHFNDANYVVMPKLPRKSQYYSVTILKSVALVWRFTHENNCKRFRMASPLLGTPRNLFAYAICQASILFDKMVPHFQLVFLASFCYELCCFLTRNGLEELIYVSYTLYTTIWREQYEGKFESAGGWKYLEKALTPFAIVHDSVDEIFLPGFPLKEEDLLKAVEELEDLIEHHGEESMNQDGEDEVEELDEESRRRKITRQDFKLLYFYYVRNSEMMRVADELEESFKENIVEYLLDQQEKRMQKRQAALLEPDALYDTEASLSAANVPLFEDKTRVPPPEDASIDSCRLSLDSCSINEDKDKLGSGGGDISKNRSSEKIEVEELPTATTGAKPIKRKSGSTGKPEARCDSEASLSAVNVPLFEDKTRELPPEDVSIDSCRLSLDSCSIHEVKDKVGCDSEETSKDRSSGDVKVEEGPTAATGVKPKKRRSGATEVKSPQKESPATSFGAKPKKNSKPESGDQTGKMKRPESSKTQNKKPAWR